MSNNPVPGQPLPVPQQIAKKNQTSPAFTCCAIILVFLLFAYCGTYSPPNKTPQEKARNDMELAGQMTAEAFYPEGRVVSSRATENDDGTTTVRVEIEIPVLKNRTQVRVLRLKYNKSGKVVDSSDELSYVR